MDGACSFFYGINIAFSFFRPAECANDQYFFDRLRKMNNENKIY
jgi:hypothetical protein